jgi:hypothetical protein
MVVRVVAVTAIALWCVGSGLGRAIFTTVAAANVAVAVALGWLFVAHGPARAAVPRGLSTCRPRARALSARRRARCTPSEHAADDFASAPRRPRRHVRRSQVDLPPALRHEKGDRRAIDHAPDPGPADRALAHRARLRRRVEREPPALGGRLRRIELDDRVHLAVPDHGLVVAVGSFGIHRPALGIRDHGCERTRRQAAGARALRACTGDRRRRASRVMGPHDTVRDESSTPSSPAVG